ncbi:MAG: terminase family protein [Clostridia bacterium]|nr:terminase family protein [Clostridia bacterium]
MEEKEIIFALLAIEKEQNRRKANDRLSRYNTGEKVHKKQLEFHKCQKRNRWVFGGNRSGKTECGAVEAVWWARGIHPYRQNRNNVSGWIVSLSYEVQRDVAQSKFLSYLNPDWIADIVMLSGKKGSAEYGVIDYVLVKNVLGGTSKVSFKSCDQGREKFQGASLDFVWFDEEPPKDVYDECRMRIIDRVGDIWGTMTPLKGLTWVYDEIYLNSSDDKEVWHQHVEWADNPFLDEKEVASLSANMDEKTLSSRRFGRFCEAEGIVYKEFDIARDVIEPFV